MHTFKASITAKEFDDLQYWRKKLAKSNRAVFREAFDLWVKHQKQNELINTDMIFVTKNGKENNAK